MSTIGGRLKDERTRLGMNQTDFGAIGSVKKETQLNYESGKRMPDAEYLAKIAAAGADVGYILTGARTPKPPAGVAENGTEYRLVTPREKAFLELMADLDDDGRRQIQELAEKEKRLKELEAAEAKRKRKA